jgi:uncharacterized phiE125 gp8 family phage protein
MQLKVLSSNITEPVSVADVRDHMGYPRTDQDAKIVKLIRVAREWLENRTALSLVNKQYKAYFECEDRKNGWFELPVAPVLSDPAIVVAVCGVTADFDQKGLDEVWIRPYDVYGTIRIGASTSTYYVEATFNAGAKNDTGNECIIRIAATMFDQRDDNSGGVTVGRLPYDTMRLIETINRNTGL